MYQHSVKQTFTQAHSAHEIYHWISFGAILSFSDVQSIACLNSLPSFPPPPALPSPVSIPLYHSHFIFSFSFYCPSLFPTSLIAPSKLSRFPIRFPFKSGRFPSKALNPEFPIAFTKEQLEHNPNYLHNFP